MILNVLIKSKLHTLSLDNMIVFGILNWYLELNSIIHWEALQTFCYFISFKVCTSTKGIGKLMISCRLSFVPFCVTSFLRIKLKRYKFVRQQWNMQHQGSRQQVNRILQCRLRRLPRHVFAVSRFATLLYSFLFNASSFSWTTLHVFEVYVFVYILCCIILRWLTCECKKSDH